MIFTFLACLGAVFASAQDLSKYLNVPVVYLIKSHEVGSVIEMRIGQLPKLGVDVDAVFGVAVPASLKSEYASFSDLQGFAGGQFSATWSFRKSPYFMKVGVGALELQGHQPSASFLLMLGSH